MADAYTPAFPSLPSLPQLPAIDDARAPNAAMRSWLLGQLPSFATQNQAALTNIQAGAKLGLAGYGGYSFAKDDPNTPQREDLTVAFDPNAGPGQREKQAFSGVVNQANAQGTLYSSFTNQNIASAAQRLSLEAQQIVNQYAQSINQQQTGYANQVAGVIGQWVGLYGSDAQYLAENPPPTPPPPPPAAPLPPGTLATPNSPASAFPTWTGSAPPNLKTLATRWGVPTSAIRVSVVNGHYTAWPQGAPNTGPQF